MIKTIKPSHILKWTCCQIKNLVGLLIVECQVAATVTWKIEGRKMVLM